MPEEPVDAEVIDSQEVHMPARIAPERFTPAALAGYMLRYYWLQAKSVLVEPARFFAGMPDDGNYVEAAMFLGISAFIYAVLQAIGHANFLVFVISFLSSIAKTIIGTFVLRFIFAKLGGKGSRSQTFKVLCYSKATLLIAWIALGKLPLGGIISLVYTLYLNVVGLTISEKLSRQHVAAIVIIVGAASFVIGLLTGI